MEILTNNAYHFSSQFREWDFSTGLGASSRHMNIVRGARHQTALLSGFDPIGYRYLLDSSSSYPWSITGARVVMTNVQDFPFTIVNCGVGNLTTGISAQSIPTSIGPSSLIGRDGRDFTHWGSGIQLGSDDYAFIRFNNLITSQTCGQIYLGSPFTFSSLDTTGIKRSTYFDWVEGYQCDEQIELSFVGATSAEVNALLQVPHLTDEPFFLYDASADYIAEKLLHVMAPELPVIQEFNDRYTVNLRCYRLHQRVWS